MNDGVDDSVEQTVTIRVVGSTILTPTSTTLTVQEDSNITVSLGDDSNSSNFIFSMVLQPQHGTLRLEVNGSLRYIPNPNFSGSDFFSYRANDGKEHNVTIKVVSVNDAPTPTFTTLRVQEDTTKVATLTAVDVDSNSSSLTFSVVTNPQHGTLSLEANGSFSYTPDSNFNGVDSFVYKVNDGVDDSVEQTVTIRVANVNNVPQIDTDFQNISISDNTTKRVDINISDLDGDSLTLNIESNSSILTINKNFTNPILQADYMDLTLDFNITSDYNVTGNARVTITLSDGDTNVSKSFDVNITKIFRSGERWRGFVYKVIKSPHTGKIWLDRNLGAPRVCTKYNDRECYGDFYQWRRNVYRDKKIKPKRIFTLSANPKDIGDKFITTSNGIDSWRILDSYGNVRSANLSSICPIGFKIPTIDELKAETIDLKGTDRVKNSHDAFDSFLKLPNVDLYVKVNYPLDFQGSYSSFWTILTGIYYSPSPYLGLRRANWKKKAIEPLAIRFVALQITTIKQ